MGYTCAYTPLYPPPSSFLFFTERQRVGVCMRRFLCF